MACGGPAPQALNFWPSCERRGGAATVLELRDRGEQGSRNPVLFDWLLTYGAQSRPVAVAALLRWGVGAACAGAVCASQLLCLLLLLLLLLLLHLLHLLHLLQLLQLLLLVGCLLQCFPGFLLFLLQMPLLFSSISLQTRSNNRHAVAPGKGKRRRHRRPFSRAARPVPISFLQEVNL